jgi:hypothetical protein
MKRLILGMAGLILGMVAAGSVLVTAFPAEAGNGATAVRGQCAREVPGYGLVSGEGVSVVAPSGQVVSVCNIPLSPPPPDTTVERFEGGNIIVTVAGGRQIAVFTPCGPSDPTSVCG